VADALAFLDGGHFSRVYINAPYSSALAEACARMRAIADEMTIFPRAQESMFYIADRYEQKAVRSEERMTTG